VVSAGLPPQDSAPSSRNLSLLTEVGPVRILADQQPQQLGNLKGEQMISESAVTISKMLESLPEQLKDQVVEHVREYIADLKDEMLWSSSFAKSQDKLADAARLALGEATQPQRYIDRLQR
jgi:hypothetical protein